MNLERIRKSQRITQNELSVKSGVNQSVISDIEKGITKSPRIETIKALARALGCTIDELISESGEKKTA